MIQSKMTREQAVKALANRYFNDEDIVAIADCLFYIRVVTKDTKWFDIDNINGCKEYTGLREIV